MKRIVIFGGNSAIARACAMEFLSRGDSVHLVSRCAEKLEATATDLTIRTGHKPSVTTADLLVTQDHIQLLREATNILGGIDIVLIAYGELGDETRAHESFLEARQIFEVNLLSVVSLCTVVASHLESQGQGLLAVISSVAGDRGRQSNYIYGSAKGALSIFLSGLRNRLHHKGIGVLTIKPGFVDTPMTAAFRKGPLWASPEKIGRGIIRAIDRRRDVVYLPHLWRVIMFVIRTLPEPIFKRLKL